MIEPGNGTTHRFAVMLSFGHQSLAPLLALLVLAGQLFVIPNACCCQARAAEAACCAERTPNVEPTTCDQSPCCSKPTATPSSCCCHEEGGEEIASRSCGCNGAGEQQDQAPTPSRQSAEELIGAVPSLVVLSLQATQPSAKATPRSDRPISVPSRQIEFCVWQT